jgi:hypothetical protein
MAPASPKRNHLDVEKPELNNGDTESPVNQLAIKSPSKKAHSSDEEYDVRNFYTDSDLARLVGSNQFTTITYIMIASNAIWIGVDADLNPADNLADAPAFVQVIEAVFGIFFVAEIIMRFLSFRDKLDTLKDFWFKFDGTLVMMALVETFVLPIVFSALDKGGRFSKRDFSGILRTARCARLIRLVRLMRVMPELLTLITGMQAAIRGTASTFILLGFLTYTFGIVFRIRVGGPPRESYSGEKSETEEEFHERTGGASVYRFRSTIESMWTLLFAGTLSDNITQVMVEIVRQSQVMAAWFMVFMAMTNFTLLSMLVGMICEVITNVDQQNKEEATVRLVKQKLSAEGFQKKIDNDDSGTVSIDEFDMLCDHEEVADVLQEVGVDVESLRGLRGYLFGPDCREEIEWNAFLDLLLSLRSSNAATVIDIAQTRFVVQTQAKAMMDSVRAESEATRQMVERNAQFVASQQAMLQAWLEEIGKKFNVRSGLQM